MKFWMFVATVTFGLALFLSGAHGGELPVTDGLTLWLRGNAGIQLNPEGAITAWQDQSGRDRHVSPVDTAHLETVDFGHGTMHPVVAVRPETDGLLTDGAHAWGEALTAFVVFRFHAAEGGANGARLLDASNSQRFILARIGTDYAFTVRGTRMPPRGPCDGDWDLVEAVYDGTEGRLNLNGEKGLSGAAAPPAASANRLGIGRRHVGGHPIGGWFAEVILYDRVLTEAEHHQVGWYLARKYHLATAHLDPVLPRVSTLPAENIAPASATLRGRLASAGIGSERADVFVYWGPGDDPGADAAAWAHSHPLGTFDADRIPAVLSHAVDGLTAGRLHAYRFVVRNEQGEHWGEPQAFTPEETRDWPLWRYNAARSGQAPAIDMLPETLHLQWVRELPSPRRAWPPQFDDRDKLEFDLSYSPVVMGGRIFVGSMTTDSLTAYAVDTGAELWRFYADGPIRVAPAAWNGRVYVPSDDGHLYCLDAATGALRWTFDARPSGHRVLGNERVISMWPVRGGPLVVDGTVYFAAGVWPFLGASLVALDAETGERVWENTGFASEWQAQPHGGAYSFSGLAPQGYLAAADDRLVVAGGRALPGIFNRRDGTLRHHRIQHGKGTGGYRVQIQDGLIFNHGLRLRLENGAGAGGGHPEVPEWEQLQARVEEIADQLDGEVFESLAAWDRLFVVTHSGRLYAFGADAVETPVLHAGRPEPSVPADTDAGRLAATILAQTGVTDGYALVLGADDGALLEQLAARSQLQIVAIEADPARMAAVRHRLDRAGLYGTRVALLPGTFSDSHYPAYITSLFVAADPAEAGLAADPETLTRIETRLRPYTGRAWLGFDPDHAAVRSAMASFQPEAARLSANAQAVLMLREGPLPETGQWTHQHADAAQSVLSRDFRVRPPFGPIWFGGPSHDNILPRHAAGPRPHVAGGRLVILGVETISARCVYTGRELWVREFPGIGHPFTNLTLEERWQQGRAVYMTNQPGATYIGSPYVSLADAVYLRYRGRIIRLDPDTGATVAEWALPVRPSRLETDPEAPDWGHISVCDGMVITTTNPHIFRGGDLGSRGDDSWDGSSSERLVALDRHTGAVAWIRDAVIGFRHNAIAAAGNRLFVNDLLTEQAIEMAVRRGLEVEQRPRLTALDIRSGAELWSQDSEVFGTFLSYSADHDILVEGATHDGRFRLRGEPGGRMIARRGRTGEILWERSGRYSGPVILRGATIIPGRPGGGICLLSGGEIQRQNPISGEDLSWSYAKSYGCGSANASSHLLLFRSGAAGFADLEHDSGTGNISGIKSGCTANMIAADGVLNAPDYTRTCTCSYQHQTSLGLIHMPEMEMWTVNRPIANINAPIHRLGVNLGAPGDRRAEDGTFWTHFPIEAPSPALNVLTLQSEFARHGGGARIVGLDGPLSGQTRAHAPEKSVDGNADSQWRTSCRGRGDFEQAGLTFTLDRAVTLDRVSLIWSGPKETEFSIEVRSPENEWATVHAGVGEGNRRTAEIYAFDPVSAHQVRIRFGAHGDASEDNRGRRRAHNVSVSQVRLGDLPFPAAYAYLQPQPIFRMNALSVVTETGWNWVGASGLRDIGEFVLRNVRGNGDHFTLRLYFAEPDARAAGQRRFDIRMGDRVLARDFAIAATAGGIHRATVLSFDDVPVEDELRLWFVATEDSEYPPVLSGVELIRTER